MKKIYFSFIVLSLICVMVVTTTGCGVRINGKEYEFYKSSQSEKKSNNIFNGIGSESRESQQVKQDKIDGEELKVSTGAGNIDIGKADGSEIIVDADKKVRGASEETKKTILENMNISIEQNGKNLDIAVRTKDGKDFWEWQKDNYKTYQITINYDIKVPESIKDLSVSTGAGNIIIEGQAEKVDASTGAGNIDVDDMKAELKLSTGAGNIDIDNSSALGNCKLSTGAGNIDFMGKVEDVNGFDASTGMGNVNFRVPSDSKMSINADTGLGKLGGSFINIEGNKSHFNGDINGGGVSIRLSTGVGNVDIDED